MAKEIPSVGDLRRKAEITDEEIEAAAAAYLTDENAKPFAFKSGHTVDVAKAIEMHPQAKKLLADKDTKPGLRRTAAQQAIVELQDAELKAQADTLLMALGRRLAQQEVRERRRRMNWGLPFCRASPLGRRLARAISPWHPAGMATLDDQTCEAKIEGVWRPISVAEAKSAYVMAPKRCPSCHGVVVLSRILR
ncbi:hypothetical protein ACU4GA_27105 [Methylobacterium oryzae CBMB20]